MEKLDVQIQPKLKKIALYTLIFMVLLHGYRYVSLGFSHDSLAFAWQPDLEWQISLGRYMQPFYWWIIRRAHCRAVHRGRAFLWIYGRLGLRRGQPA